MRGDQAVEGIPRPDEGHGPPDDALERRVVDGPAWVLVNGIGRGRARECAAPGFLKELHLKHGEGREVETPGVARQSLRPPMTCHEEQDRIRVEQDQRRRYQGCSFDAKMSQFVTHIPAALAVAFPGSIWHGVRHGQGPFVVMNAFDGLAGLIQALNTEKVDYVLFGGQAVNLHGIPRFTEDIDLLVSPAAENVRRLRSALHKLWQDPAIDEIREEDLSGEYAVVRYGTPDGFCIDLASRIGEVFRFEEVESENLVIGDLRVRIATPRMLYRMKKDTLRPIDHADAADLKAKFRLDEE